MIEVDCKVGTHTHTTNTKYFRSLACAQELWKPVTTRAPCDSILDEPHRNQGSPVVKYFVK